MTAETLPEAARVLRERAEAATPGPWSLAEDWAYVASGSDGVIHGYYEGDCPACGDEIKDEASVALGGEDAQWIATMHPGVGLDLADLLETLGSAWGMDHRAGLSGCRRCTMKPPNAHGPCVMCQAEDVARAILGESA